MKAPTTSALRMAASLRLCEMACPESQRGVVPCPSGRRVGAAILANQTGGICRLCWSGSGTLPRLRGKAGMGAATRAAPAPSRPSPASCGRRGDALSRIQHALPASADGDHCRVRRHSGAVHHSIRIPVVLIRSARLSCSRRTNAAICSGVPPTASGSPPESTMI